MELADKVYDRAAIPINRLMVRPFVVNTLPKSGTNLLTKSLRLMPGIRNSGQSVWVKLAREAVERDLDGTPSVLVGIAHPTPVPLAAVEARLRAMGRAQYATWHVPYSETLAAVLTRMQTPMLLTMRDPRDVAVSHMRYTVDTPEQLLHAYFLNLPEPDRLTASITGVSEAESGDVRLASIDERCRSLMAWSAYPATYIVHFERLVGAQGGGSARAQTDELRQIIEFLGVRLSARRFRLITENVFGGTQTFRKGQIGGWRDHFTAQHKQVFKDVAGSLLVDLGYEQNNDW